MVKYRLISSKTKVTDLNLGTRIANALYKNHIKTAGQLIKIRNQYKDFEQFSILICNLEGLGYASAGYIQQCINEFTTVDYLVDKNPELLPVSPDQ